MYFSWNVGKKLCVEIKIFLKIGFPVSFTQKKNHVDQTILCTLQLSWMVKDCFLHLHFFAMTGKQINGNSPLRNYQGQKRTFH